MMELPPPANVIDISAPEYGNNTPVDLQQQGSQGETLDEKQERLKVEAKEVSSKLSDLLNQGHSIMDSLKIIAETYPNLNVRILATVTVSVKGQSTGGDIKIELVGDGKGNFGMFSSEVVPKQSAVSIHNGPTIVRGLLSQNLAGVGKVNVSASAAGESKNLPGTITQVSLFITDTQNGNQDKLVNLTKDSANSSFTAEGNLGFTEAIMPPDLPMHMSGSDVTPPGTGDLVITPAAKQGFAATATEAGLVQLPVARTAIDNSVPQAQAELVTPVGTPEFAPAVFNMNNVLHFPANINVQHVRFNQPFNLNSHPNIPLVIIYENNHVRVKVLNAEGKPKSSTELSAEERKVSEQVYINLQYVPGEQELTLQKSE